MATTATLYPTSDVSNAGTWAAAPLYSRVDDQSDADYNECQVTTMPANSIVGFGDMPSAVSIDSVTMYWRAWRANAGFTDETSRGVLTTNGGTYYTTTYDLNATADLRSHTWTTNPNTGVAWTVPLVNAIVGGWEYIATAPSGNALWSSMYLVVTYTPVPASISVARQLASVDLWLKRRPEMYATFRGNLDALNVAMLGGVDLEHTAGFHPTSDGWGPEVWERRPFAMHGMDIDLDSMSVTSRLKDQRPIQCLMRHLAWSAKPSGTIEDGIAKFATPGALFTHTRASDASFTDPMSESVTVPANIPAYAGPDGGLQILPASGARVIDLSVVSNDSGERVWCAAQGSFECEVKFAAVSGAVDQMMVSVPHSGTHYACLYWSGANSQWRFLVVVGGVAAYAYTTGTPNTTDWYHVGCRWIGTQTEHGLAAYTLSIYLNGTIGTNAVAAGVMTEAATCNMEFGTYSGGSILNGMIRKAYSYQYPRSDVEMSRAI